MTPHRRRYREEWKGRQTLLFFCISVFFSFYPSISSVQAQDTLAFRVVSYNVENLFDTRHDSLKNDYEFLPESTRHWNYPKYRKKLDDIGRTLIAVGGWTPPALVALCEVENDSVLRDLTRYSVLREAGYRYVMTHSRDERGIDVALLYQRGLFKLLSCHSITVSKPRPSDRPTRDILHASGLLLNGDTLDVLVAHFPSRSGGAKESEPYRLMAAHQLKRTADSLIARRRYPQLLIMGDFNDYPHNRSIRKILQANAPQPGESISSRRLYHLLARKARTQKSFGSYKYQGEWRLLDHLIVSGNLLQTDAPLSTSEAHADVARLPFLLTEDKKFGGRQPFRTYLGPRYLGGISDHLPVWVEFRLIY